MRVALLGPANSIHLQRWSSALAARGHAVRLFSQHPADAGSAVAGVEVESLPHRGVAGYFLNAPKLRSALAGWRPRLLHVHYASGYGTTAALCGFRPSLLSVWGSDVYEFPNQGPLHKALLRRNLRQATAVASTSHAMAEQVRRITPERDQIAITPFGVDLDRFGPRAAPRIPGRMTIGTVKRLEPKYGIDLLLAAFAALSNDAELRATGIDLRLLVVGAGPSAESLRDLARALGIETRTEFVGAVPHADVPACLRRLDIYVAASRLESFGVAVVEASACALPVVVSDVGGLPEVVRAEETGLIVPRENVSALQAALKRLVLDAALRERLGRAGRALVERDYGWQHCVDLMERCYERTVVMANAP